MRSRILIKGMGCLVLMLMLLNCSYAQKTVKLEKGQRPEWVDNPLEYYPESVYIVGVGSGDTRQAAERDATGNIARVFQSRITVDETVIQNYLETSAQTGSELSFSTQMLNQTAISSDQNLKNIKMERAWFSSSEGLYYVLATLDRRETAHLYQQDIENNDALVQEYLQKSEQASNKLNRYAFLSKARNIFQINQILNQQYQVLTAGRQVDLSVSQSALDEQMRNLLDQITVQIKAGTETDAEVADYLRETIGKIGFKVIDGPADFIFTHSLSLYPTDLNRPNIVAFNWKLTVKVDDNINKYTLKAFNINKRTAAISEGEAKSKIMRLVQQELTTNFYKQFLNYVNSL